MTSRSNSKKRKVKEAETNKPRDDESNVLNSLTIIYEATETVSQPKNEFPSKESMTRANLESVCSFEVEYELAQEVTVEGK